MRYLSVIVLLLLVASCDKPQVICDPSPHEGLETFGFIIRDGNYNNLMLANDSSHLDTSGIRVLQPCNDRNGKYYVEEKGIFRFESYGIGTCNTTIVQWPDYDADTFTYSVSGRPNGCGGTQLYIDASSLRLNGRMPELDTVLQRGYSAVYTIRK